MSLSKPEALKPCPFCGCTDKPKWYGDKLLCRGCPVAITTCFTGGLEMELEDFIAAWNRRATPPAAASALEGAVEPDDVDAIQFCINAVGAQETARHADKATLAQAQLAALVDAGRRPDPRVEGKGMLVHATPTHEITLIDEVPARVWDAVTDSGVRFMIFANRIAVHEDQDPSEFERELKQMPAPRELQSALQVFATRLVH